MNKYIVWQTDFTLNWPFVTTMKGVCKQVDPTIECIDSTHTIEQFNILEASQQLNYIEPFYPSGTVFVSVVDPGVGSSRKASVAKLKDGNYVVTPDNGTLTHLYYNVGIEEIREISPKLRYQGSENVSVFHGRDIFAYVAALLVAGKVSFNEVGEAYDINDIVLLDHQYLSCEVTGENIDGIVSNVSDPFGSIVFNILTQDFMKYYHFNESIHIILENDQGIYFDQYVLYGQAFSDVDIKQPILFNSSSNYISIGLNQGSFKDKYQVKAGINYKVHICK